MRPVKPASKIIDKTIPITWVITSVVSLVIACGVFLEKLNTISNSIIKLEARFDKREDTTQMILIQLGETKLQIDQLTLNQVKTQSEIDKMRNDIEDLKVRAAQKR